MPHKMIGPHTYHNSSSFMSYDTFCNTSLIFVLWLQVKIASKIDSRTLQWINGMWREHIMFTLFNLAHHCWFPSTIVCKQAVRFLSWWHSDKPGFADQHIRISTLNVTKSYLFHIETMLCCHVLYKLKDMTHVAPFLFHTVYNNLLCMGHHSHSENTWYCFHTMECSSDLNTFK